MTTRQQYMPGPADLARVQKDGENWTLVLVRQLRHPPEKVWRALTDPAQLREWAPFDADGNMGIAGATVKLNTVGTPTPMISETRIKRADAPNVLLIVLDTVRADHLSLSGYFRPTSPSLKRLAERVAQLEAELAKRSDRADKMSK